jgi:hypothetical protein
MRWSESRTPMSSPCFFDQLETVSGAGGGEDAEFVPERLLEVLQGFLFVIDIEDSDIF